MDGFRVPGCDDAGMQFKFRRLALSMGFDVLLPRHPNDLLGEIRTSDNTVFFCSKKKVVYTTEK